MTNITMYHQYREGIEDNPERDAWLQELEEYTCNQIEQQNSSNVFWKQAESYTLKV